MKQLKSTLSKPLNYAGLLSAIVKRNNGTQAGLNALKQSIARGIKVLKTTTPLDLLLAIYCMAAITAIVWAVTFLLFNSAYLLNS